MFIHNMEKIAVKRVNKASKRYSKVRDVYYWLKKKKQIFNYNFIIPRISGNFLLSIILPRRLEQICLYFLA